MTESIGLGIAVIVLPLRNPLLLARELASIDRLSGGRLTVGVGLGAGDDERAARLGFPAGRPVRRLVENVEVLRAAWTQPEATHDGELYRFAGLPLEPKPVSQPHPPIWIGARTERALRRAVRIGDGWIGSGSSSVDDFVSQSAIVREELAARGRDPAGFPIAKRVYIAVGDGGRLVERARRDVRPGPASAPASPSRAHPTRSPSSSPGCARPARRSSWLEILHVARPHLEHIRVFRNQRHQVVGDHLGDHRQPGQLARFGEQLQPFFAQTLEGIGRGARFVRSAAQHLRPGFFDRLGSFQQLAAALHRTRPGHDQHLVAAHLQPV